MTRSRYRTSYTCTVSLAVLLAIGFAGAAATPIAAQEKAIVPEKNPPGDIPDN